MQTLVQGNGQALYQRAKQRIPGGTQLLSKRPEMMLPEQWPAYYARVRGVEVWDLDGRRHIDMSHNSVGSCVLGVGDPDVNQAVTTAIQAGTMSTLNAPEEVELAELLCALHPWADMARYARTGGEVMAMAVRIARACTGRDKVAFCGYHGWHDWYLAANLNLDDALEGHLLAGLAPEGVPKALADTALPFRYNRPDQLEAIVNAHGSSLAAIVMEPMRSEEPAPGFLETVRRLAARAGAVLIFDEITAAWRLNTGGVHLRFGVNPDMAVFAKAIGNGYPMAAVIGTAEVMGAAQETFISSTYWTERIGPVAALATIRKHQRCNVPEHLISMGERIQNGWRAAAERTGLSITITGMPPLSYIAFDYENAQAVSTLFTQEMLDRGFLATRGFYATYAHTPEHADEYLHHVENVFESLVDALEQNRVETRLRGPIAHDGFKRLT